MKKEELIKLINAIVPDGGEVVIQGNQRLDKGRNIIDPPVYEILGIGPSIGYGFRLMQDDAIKRKID